MRLTFSGLMAALAALALCGPSQAQVTAGPVTLTPLWTLDGLQSPESAQLSADRTLLYVSNIGGEADVRDGDGHISRVSLDGRMLEQRWAVGMDAPKGTVLRDGRLFVTDIDRIVEIDAADGRVVGRYPAPDARFLNDLALAPDGTVLASDSGGARIYGLKGDRLEIWAIDPRLQGINGLLSEPDRLVISTMAGVVLTMHWGTKTLDLLAVGVGAGDGVARLPDGSYVVSEWPGRLFYIGRTGQRSTLLDTREGEIYQNDFLVIGDLLIVPNVKPGRLTAHRVVGAGETPPPGR